MISKKITSYGNALKLHDRMFEVPTFSINSAKEIMGCAFVTAATVVEQFQEHGFVREITGNVITLEGHSHAITQVAYSPDGQSIGTSFSGISYVWDAATGKQRWIERTGRGSGYSRFAWSPDGKKLAVGGSTLRYPMLGLLQIWNVETGKVAMTLEGYRDTIVSVAFSPDGKRLASPGGPWESKASFGEVKIWDMQTGQEVGALPDHSNTVYGVDFSPSGGYLAAATHDGKVLVFDGTPTVQD